MNNYQKPTTKIWKGRNSDDQLYLHEKIQCIDLKKDPLPKSSNKKIALLGYACDEGIRRNQGRIGAIDGPNTIRKMMGTLSNHFPDQKEIFDIGNMVCHLGNLEETHLSIANCIALLLNNGYFPMIMGGGHDLAYAHFLGIKKVFSDKKVGIINLDAHFDLRKVTNKANSGTPFYQIAKETNDFKYLCLGIQKESNNRELFKTANELNVQYIQNTAFNLDNKEHIITSIFDFIATVDHIYLTIDMDGFSANYAPGVSAPSPYGFSIDIATEVIHSICMSNKLISVDLVELNPIYDIDNCTARLASRLLYKIMDWI